MTMKTLKLWVHTKKISDKQGDEILINPKWIPEVIIGDVLEIYHPEEEYSRLLLQIKSLPEDFQPKDNVVSIEQSIAAAFQLKTYHNVIVNKVDIKVITVDLVEVLFKDQYYSRSDMHRLRNSMIGNGVYLNKNIKFSEMRVQINELWCRGEKVTCGVISEDTRIVFRSSTAVVHIFIQMSSEMWDFDFNGDLYFEKAVNGFLTDLYAKWKEQNSCHDVTIVLFSRTFYEAQSRDEFPPYMQECLQQDYLGRFYEDFYRIVVQNERYEEWTDTIKELRKLFNEYPRRVLNYHNRPGYRVPKSYNSTAAQGNFLETLNMTINLFEKYYMDRNFDRTGKVAVVITAGAGVFEVDRELTNITKQRTIDCGIGSDLVCMGEQPLHAAPLFKFHNVDKSRTTVFEVGDDYNIPHWMNHSFYTSKNQIQFYSNKTFVPRIKIPPEVLDKRKQKEFDVHQDLPYSSDDDNFPFVEYEEYDGQIFKLPNRNALNLGYNSYNSGHRLHRLDSRKQPQTFLEEKQFHIPRTRHISDDISCLPVDKSDKKSCSGTSSSLSIPSRSSSGEDLSSSLGCYPIQEKSDYEWFPEPHTDNYLGTRLVVGSAGSPVGHRKFLHNYKRHRALINPFAPSRMQFKMTSNRRRWVHAFPTDPQGAAVQTHHVHVNSYSEDIDSNDTLHIGEPTSEVVQANRLAAEAMKEQSFSKANDNCVDLRSIEDQLSLVDVTVRHKRSSYGSGSTQRNQKEKEQRFFLWGPTGEQAWSPELTTGQDWRPLADAEMSYTESRLVKPILTAHFENTQHFCASISVDWKSLTMPASLPITTDYFPENVSLQKDYVVAGYTLLTDEVASEYYMNPPVSEDEKYYRKQPLSNKEVFNELISQRIAQGFQVILLGKSIATQQTINTSQAVVSQRSVMGTSPQVSCMSGLRRARPRETQLEEVYLSIGRIFHKLSLCGSTITVTRYRPRHPNQQMCYSYKYRFQAPDSYNYDVSWSEFRNEKLENYNWNHLDQYICTRGEGEFGLTEPLKFWRSRFLILPCTNQGTKRIAEGHSRCDIYEDRTANEMRNLIVGFTRYLEILNKMKRTAMTRTITCKHKEFLDKNPCGIPQPDTRPEDEILTLSSPSSKIVAWMLDPVCGIPMLPKQLGLPQQSFISAEIVEWCYYHVKGIKGISTSMEMLQQLMDDGYIVHASGSLTHKVIYGFYIYTFVSKDKTKEEQGIIYCPLFQNEWCEVAYIPVIEDVDPTCTKFTLDGDCTQNFCASVAHPEDWRVNTGLEKRCQTWVQESATLLHKYVNLDVDPHNKSDRPEWATARYHAYYSPSSAFEFQVQWMVATGQILGDLVNNWARKASVCGFHLLPVPVDPFALPTAPDSDPLRGPIFIPLDISCMEPAGILFSSYDEDTKQQKMLQMQEAIVKRFGFMHSDVRITNIKKPHFHASTVEEHHQYVHCTGGMFIIIEDIQSIDSLPVVLETNTVNTVIGSEGKTVKNSASFSKKSSAEMRKDYIARQTSQVIKEKELKIGFLWSWNFLLSKKWRGASTGDDYLQEIILKDFRAFCSNADDRLRQFWMKYRELNAV